MEAGARGAHAGLDGAQVGRILGALRDGTAGSTHARVMECLLDAGLAPAQARGAAGRIRDLYAGLLGPELAGNPAGADPAPGAEGGPLRRAEEADEDEANERAFNEFSEAHKDDPEHRGRYAAFVHGKYQMSGPSRTPLVMEMYGRFGNVSMYVGEVGAPMRTAVVESPELVRS